MMRPTLLVLTKQFCFLDKFKFTISKLIGSQYDSSSVLLGHPAVTRSLLDGLRKLEVPFTYNPPMVSVPFDLCVVPCTAQVVLQAINLKRRGLVRKLLVGPNISVRSNEHNGLLAAWLGWFYVHTVGRVWIWIRNMYSLFKVLRLR